MKTYIPTEPETKQRPGLRDTDVTKWFHYSATLKKELQERGFVQYQLAHELMVWVQVSKKEFASKLGVDPRTLTRFKQKGELSPAASDRLYRLARLLEVATELHDGDEVRAMRWLKTPNRALGDRRPIDMVATQPDFERVMDLVGALEEGVFV